MQSGAPLVGPDNVLALLALAAALVAACYAVERISRPLTIPAPTAALAFGMFASNLGLMPAGGATHASVLTYAIPIALPLLLFKADLRVVMTGIGSMLIPFVVACAATLGAIMIAFLAAGLSAQDVAFAATNAAGFLGGSVNFLAVAKAEGLSAEQFAIASAAFVVIFVPYLMALQWLVSQSWVRARFPASPAAKAAHAAEAKAEPPARAQTNEAIPFGLVCALALAGVIAAAGTWIAEALDAGHLALVAITGLALIAANVAPTALRRIEGEQAIATYLLMIYFVFIGSTAEARALVDSAGPLTLFVGLAIALHIVLLLVFGWALRQPLDELVLASNATIGGPATASALAQSIGATRLITPSVLAGVLGYATATFIALTLARALRAAVG